MPKAYAAGLGIPACIKCIFEFSILKTMKIS
jgi:hypothetical protein